MAKINGTNLLLYCNGTVIALQKSCTISWEQDLPGATTKDSAGWSEHINGTRTASVDFDGLFSTTGLSAVTLMGYITSRTSVLLLVDGGGFPIVGEVDLKSFSINATKEEAAGISGSFKSKGPLWMLTGAYVNVITDPDGIGNSGYEVLTTSGISITQAQNDSGTCSMGANGFAASINDVYKLITFVTDLGSTQFPSVYISKGGGVSISNTVTLTAGINIHTLTVTETQSAYLRFENTAYANWQTTNLYLFKV
jgi:hypothetical protein